ncbi:MAG: BatA domain-containing protein, partial [Planctomycetota bacterium]
MSFTEWIFLLGGLAVVGPVIAHLLAKPRYRRLPFTMLRFLRSGQVESQSRRKLRDLLILLLRCAIIILIAM